LSGQGQYTLTNSLKYTKKGDFIK